MWGSQASQPSADIPFLTVHLLDLKLETAHLWAQSHSQAESNLINKNQATAHRLAAMLAATVMHRHMVENVLHKEEHNPPTTQGKLVKLSLVLVSHFGCLLSCVFLCQWGGNRGNIRELFNGVFSVSLLDSYRWGVQCIWTCKLTQKSTDAAKK